MVLKSKFDAGGLDNGTEALEELRMMASAGEPLIDITAGAIRETVEQPGDSLINTSENVVETEVPADLAEIASLEAPMGYDLVEAKEDAVLHCALIIHHSVKALNDAHNEHTIDWESNKQSILAGVRRMIENPGETPEQNHNAWMVYKRKEGYNLGPTKSEKLRTHPCMVPYDMLPPIQKSKDLIFQAIVRTYFGL